MPHSKSKKQKNARLQGCEKEAQKFLPHDLPRDPQNPEAVECDRTITTPPAGSVGKPKKVSLNTNVSCKSSAHVIDTLSNFFFYFLFKL